MTTLQIRLRQAAHDIRESWSDLAPCSKFPHYHDNDMAHAALLDAAADEIDRLTRMTLTTALYKGEG